MSEWEGVRDMSGRWRSQLHVKWMDGWTRSAGLHEGDVGESFGHS